MTELTSSWWERGNREDRREFERWQWSSRRMRDYQMR